MAFGEDRFSQNPMPQDVIPLSEQWEAQVGAVMTSCPSSDISLQNFPTTLYNAVVYPLAPYALSGVVWYQGESNTGNPAPYGDYLTKMMGCWRDRWQKPQMPFVIVQLSLIICPSPPRRNLSTAVGLLSANSSGRQRRQNVSKKESP